MKTKQYKKTNMKTLKQTPQKKKIDKNTILAYILAGLMVFWTIASVFSFIAYGKVKKEENNTISASAQTIEQLTAGQYVIDLPVITGFTLTSGLDTMIYTGKYQVIFTNGTVTLDIANGAYTHAFARGTNICACPRYSAEDREIATSYFYVFVDDYTNLTADFYQRWDEIEVKADIANSNGLRIHYTFTFRNNTATTLNTAFDFSIYLTTQTMPEGYWTIMSPDLNEYGEYALSQYEENAQGVSIAEFVKYYDMANLLEPGAVSVYEQGYNAGYKVGYDAGYEQGDVSGNAGGYDTGYTDGRNVGYEEGYDVGFGDGVENANDYSFVALISSVVDVPVRTFTSLFDFDFLGINLASFFLSLLTIAVILAVIRLIW